MKKFESLGEVIGARQFETRTASRQIDNMTFNRHRLRPKKDFPDSGNQTPWGHAKPASFVRPVHLSAKIESLHLYGPLITDPLRRGAQYLTEIMEHSPSIEFHLLVGLVPDQTARTALTDPSGDDGMRCRACSENPQFCDAWHIDGFPEDYFELWKENPNPR